VNVHNRPRSFRGTAILIRKTLLANFKSFTSVTENICVVRITIGNKELAVINFHSPTEGNPQVYGEYAKLGALIRRLENQCEIVLMGDFNAHLGFVDREENCEKIGPILGHFESNSNGRMLSCFIQVQNNKDVF
jgi:exonuclease III